jgi:DDE superfamily endonuclease
MEKLEETTVDESSDELSVTSEVLQPMQTVLIGIQSVMLSVLHYIGTRYTPTGIRTVYTDASELTTLQLLAGRPERIPDMTRLKSEVFLELLRWLSENSKLKDTRQVSSAEKLMIFLYICAHGVKFRVAAEALQHSTRTIHLAFYEVLNALLLLHQKVVTPPPDRTPDEIEQNDQHWPYFADCIGALDGNHIGAWIPQKNQARWRNRIGQISQNVLAACDFKMNFVYVLPGWEGSALDGRVFGDARARGFHAPPEKYYLADAGYPSTSLTLTPYLGIKYQLREEARGTQRPQNAEELFNMRHASLRSVVERTFEVLKGRFAILREPPRRYSIRTQVHLVFALTAVHNFMNLHGCDPEAESLVIANESPEEPVEDQSAINQGAPRDHDASVNARRDGIAQLMWEDYQAYNKSLGDIK